MKRVGRRQWVTRGVQGCVVLSVVCSAASAMSQQVGEAVGTGHAFKRHWLGLHYAHDFGSVDMSGSDVCVTQIQVEKDYACYFHDSSDRYFSNFTGTAAHPFPQGEPYPGAGISGPVAVSYDRFLLSYDFAIISKFTVGVRLGWVAGGNRRPGTSGAVALNHLEMRAAYWFLGLEGVMRPYVHVSAGTLGTIHAKAELQAYECAYFQDVDAFNRCVSGDPAMRDQLIAQSTTASDPTTVAPKLDVYKDKDGMFIGAGGGLMVAFSQNAGVVLNLSILSVASSVFVEPSAGVVVGL